MRYLFCILALPLLAACLIEDDDASGDTLTATRQVGASTATIAGDAPEPDTSSAATAAVDDSLQTATAAGESSLPTLTPAADAQTPESEPAPTSAAVEYARQGYHHYERPEIALMIHPRLTEEGTDPPTDEDTLYSFVDLNNLYLHLDVDILHGIGLMSEVSDGFIRDHLAALIESAPHISTYEIFDSQETTLTGQPGRIARFNFTSDGEPAYGAILLFTVDDWLYRFLVYGDSHEYPTLEDIIRSIFSTAHLRGPA